MFVVFYNKATRPLIWFHHHHNRTNQPKEICVENTERGKFKAKDSVIVAEDKLLVIIITSHLCESGCEVK
jgi:hypothetical protein